MVRLCLSLMLIILTGISSALEWTYTNTETGIDKLALGYPVPLPIQSVTAVDGFRSYLSLHARHQDMMLLSDNISGQVIGQTFNNRDIWAYQLSDPDNLTDQGFLVEGAALQNGGIHAREWSTPEVTTAIMERFAENEADHWLYQYLLQNMNLVIIPVLNVDGFLQTQRHPDKTLQSAFSEDPSTWPRDGRMRRKNMRNVDEDLATPGDALLGIDLNRNQNPFWASSTRSSSNTSSLVYHGVSAGSEPESNALHQAANLGPANRLRFYIDTHSFSQLWYMPNTGVSRRNSIASKVATRMQAATNNSYAISPNQANVGIGSTDEYFAYTYQIPSYTLETEPQIDGAVQYGGYGVSHDGFILPESEIARVRKELTDASVIAWYMQSGPASVKAIEITDTADNSVIFSGQWNGTSATTREWQEDVNLGLTKDHTYSLWVAYDKPMRWLNDLGEIANFPNLFTALAPRFSVESKDVAGAGFRQTVEGQATDWLVNPGGPGQGYLNYKTDAFMLEFTLSTSIDPATASLISMAFDNRDFAGSLNDANPMTVVDYNQFWLNYESADGSLADNGGMDRMIRLVDDASPLYVDPTIVITNPPPAPEPSQPSGGGSMTFGTLILLILLQIRRKMGYSGLRSTDFRRSKYAS